jgi:ATP-dependent Clp protease ATP-binding subunit ClpA
MVQTKPQEGQEFFAPVAERTARILSVNLTELCKSVVRDDEWLVRFPPVEFLENSHALLNAVDCLARALHRRRFPHAVLCGPPGVGKSTVAYRLALHVASGQYPRLASTTTNWIDCSSVGACNARRLLESITSLLERREDMILVLHGLRKLLIDSASSNARADLLGLTSAACGRIVATMTGWEYQQVIASDSTLRQRLSRIDCEEPDSETSVSLCRRRAEQLCHLYGQEIENSIVDRTVELGAMFLMHRPEPARSLGVLEQVFDDVAFDRLHSGRKVARVQLNDVIRRLAAETGLPAETVRGQDSGADFRAALRDAVVGQDHAVSVVARELQLIKAGLSEPGKPASVLMFAGMSGVGKTELAKRIAELYSGSRRLKVYSMGSFTEPHSVSGIIGVPPGYVGFEEGGRLINELNADPYSVFLLDESEKCHPNIWKPFLNLFDEGWIADQRGVRAYADRAIFILTTNAGDRAIQQLVESGSDKAAIEEKVRSTLSRVRHERSSQAVFPPQFLARLKQIIVFNPLDETALRGITERACRRVTGLWRQRRRVELVIEQPVIEWITSKAVDRSRQTSGNEGGRIVRKLISEFVELAIQEQAILNPEAYESAGVIHIRMRTPDETTQMAAVEVVFVH